MPPWPPKSPADAVHARSSQPRGVLSVAQNPPSCPRKGRSAAPGLKGKVLRQSRALPSHQRPLAAEQVASPLPRLPGGPKHGRSPGPWGTGSLPSSHPPPPGLHTGPCVLPTVAGTANCRDTDLGNLRGLSSSFHGLLGGGGLFAWVIRVLVVGVLVVVRITFAFSLRVLKANRGHVRKAGPHQEPSYSPHRPGSARKSGHQRSRLRTGLCWLQLLGRLRQPREKHKGKNGGPGPFQRKLSSKRCRCSDPLELRARTASQAVGSSGTLLSL